MAQVVLAGRKFEVFYVIDKDFETPVQLTARQRCAQTIVSAGTEAQVRARVLAFKVYALRVVEVSGVAIAGCVA